MEQTIFNWHDLVLLLTAFECFIVGLIVFSLRRPVPLTLVLLGLVSMCYGGIALNEMIIWGVSFRYWILHASANFFFILSFSYWCAGPLLWLLSKRVTNARLHKVHYVIHFLPACLMLVYLWQTFWGLPPSEKISLIENYHFDNSWHYPWVELAARAQRWLYSVFAIRAMWPLLRESCLPLKCGQREGRWFLSALLALVSVEFIAALLKLSNSFFAEPLEWLGGMSLTVNYANFLLVNLFLYAWLKPQYARLVSSPTSNEKPAVDSSILKVIEEGLFQQRLFLNPHLSVERFAKAVGLRSKQVSYAINRHYGMSFMELMNQHRIAEAKKRLEDPANAHLSITDVFYQSGFNSKSVYNKIFKVKCQCTPSEYRKSVRNQRAN